MTSDVLAHAVHFTLPEVAVPDDNYFDLLPGETCEVTIASVRPLKPAQVGVTSVVPPR